MVLSHFLDIIFNETNHDIKGFFFVVSGVRTLDLAYLMIQKDVVLFFSIKFFFGKVLMRHTLLRHPKWSVMNIISGCPQTLCTYLLSDTILQKNCH